MKKFREGFWITAVTLIAIGGACPSTNAGITDRLPRGGEKSESQGASAQLADTQSGYVHYKFRLKHGAGSPVCEANLQRLNRTVYLYPPYCKWGVPLTDSVPGFTEIPRQLLTPKQLWQVISHGYSFLYGQSPNPNRAAMRKYEGGELTYDPDYSLSDVEKISAGLGPFFNFSAFLYKDLDVNNDGRPVPIMLWDGGIKSNGNCFNDWSPSSSNSGRLQSYAFVMNEDSSDIDDAQTRAVFGVTSGNPIGHAFFPVGDTVSFFAYQGKIYFDSFEGGNYSALKDMQMGRADTQRYRTLNVFQRRNGHTEKLCTYQASQDPRD